MEEPLINVAIPGTPRRFFTYRLPDNHRAAPEPGQRLVVPLGRRKAVGYFIETTVTKPEAELKSVLDFLDPYPLFSKELFGFLTWMADYYYANIADVLNAAIPPGLRKIKKPSYIPTKRFDELTRSGQIPQSVAEKITAKNLLTPRDIRTIEDSSPALIDRMIRSGALATTWAGVRSFQTGILLGYRIDNSQSVNDNAIEEIKKSESDSKLLRKKDILAHGVSEYRFRKLVKQGLLTPIYGLPDLFDYIKPRSEVDAIVPNREQNEAVREITDNLDHFAPFLLYGITGSGKTLVYCQIARKVLEKGKTILVLVPEIALAGTLLSYFRSFFQDEIALLHSGLRPSERVLVWQNIRSGRYKIVIGARSAIFAPLEKPGLIIVDEEHDESYKQDDPAPRFQARDAAVMRAKMAGIPVVLGSASPSIESFYNTELERYKLLKLTHRPEKAEIPVVRLVDLRRELPARDNLFFTGTMTSALKDSLKSNNQIILYLNRRGFSPRIKCADCGHTPTCPHCNISLTYHKTGSRLMCHFCGYTDAHYNSCAGCGGDNFIYLGTGTQKIEDKIGELFDDAKMIRLDSDSAFGRQRAHVILSDFAAKKYNVLLGTQMVTKGIDFPDVSLVGVLLADIGLDMPDFRASEKLFAKLIQVSGRSGRGIIPGEVIIQTFNPELDLIDDAARQDYDTFYAREIQSRRKLSYPPFSHMVNFRFSAKKEDAVIKQSLDFKSRLELRLEGTGLRVHLLGPAPCPLYRLRGLYRRHLFIKTRQILKFLRLLNNWEQTEPRFGLSPRIRVIVDVDPYDMM